MSGRSSRVLILSDNNRKTARTMENIREQIFQVTDNFLTAIQQLTAQHAALLLQETFSSLGSSKPRATPGAAARTTAPTAPRSRGAKRGDDELEQLSTRFVQFVQANPGLRIEQINKQLGTTTAELALPIRKLVSSGGVTVKGQKRSTTYFAGKNSGAQPVANDDESGGKTAEKGKKGSRSKKSRARGSKSKK